MKQATCYAHVVFLAAILFEISTRIKHYTYCLYRGLSPSLRKVSNVFRHHFITFVIVLTIEYI